MSKRKIYTKTLIESICQELGYSILEFIFDSNAGSHSTLCLKCNICKSLINVKYIPDLVRYPQCSSCANKRRAEKFEQQRARDQWLREYCEQNGIHLIEIDGQKRSIFGDNILAYLEQELISVSKIAVG